SSSTRRGPTRPWPAVFCGPERYGRGLRFLRGRLLPWSVVAWPAVVSVLGGIVCWTPALAAAEPAERVGAPPAQPVLAVVRTRGDQVSAQRLTAELAALGYRVVEITGLEAVRPLAMIARERGMDALLRATPSRTGIELVVLGQPGGAAEDRPEVVEEV